MREWQSKLVFSCWDGKYGGGLLDASTMRATPLSIPGNNDSSVAFAAELNGDQWFIDRRHSSLIGIAANGTLRDITLSPPLYAFDLKAANERLWYVDNATYAITAVSLDGKVTRYHIPSARRDSETGMAPIDELVTDADGNVWF